MKGAAAVARDSVEIDALGPVGDRRYCLARPGGRVFTQRDDANLARLSAALQGERLALDFDGEKLEIERDAFTAAAEIRVWSCKATVRVADARINARLTCWFGTPLELARLERPPQRSW